jgi:stringent starvation protein B
MTSSRPYLLRAIHQWIVDNGLTPHLVVSAERPDVRVPSQFVKDGKIVLNVSPSAVRGLVLGDENIEFDARFGGTPFRSMVPVAAVMAVYAKENGVGMTFGEDQPDGTDPDGQGPGSAGKGDERPRLRVVK